MYFKRKNLKVRTQYNILNFPALFSELVVPANSAGRAAIAQLCGRIQNAVSSSHFENFSPVIHALENIDFGAKIQTFFTSIFLNI